MKKNFFKTIIIISMMAAGTTAFADEAVKTETTKVRSPMYIQAGLGYGGRVIENTISYDDGFMMDFTYGINPFSNKTMAIEAGANINFKPSYDHRKVSNSFVPKVLFIKEIGKDESKFKPFVDGGIGLDFITLNWYEYELDYYSYEPTKVSKQSSLFSFLVIGVAGINYQINDKFTAGGRFELGLSNNVNLNLQATVRYNF